MRKIILLAAAIAYSFLLAAQSDNQQLNKRLNEYLLLNKQLKFEEMMEYIHPSLFKIAPKEQIVQLFEQIFNNDAMKASIDSISVLTVSEPMSFKNIDYRKIDYYMEVSFHFYDSSLVEEKKFIDKIVDGLQQGFPNGKVSFEENTKAFLIKNASIMFGIKEREAAWQFLGYDKNPALNVLFPAEVLEHFKLQ